MNMNKDLEKYLKRLNLTDDQKILLYIKLLDESKLKDTYENTESILREEITKLLIQENIISENLINLLNSNGDLFSYFNSIYIDCSKNFPEVNLKGNYPDKTNTREWVVDLLNKKVIERVDIIDISTILQINMNINIPSKLNIFEKISNTLLNLKTKDIKKYNKIKDLCIKLLELKFDIENFLIGYKKRYYSCNFLPNCKTWSNLYKINKDWFYKLYEIESKKDNYKIKIIEDLVDENKKDKLINYLFN